MYQDQYSHLVYPKHIVLNIKSVKTLTQLVIKVSIDRKTGSVRKHLFFKNYVQREPFLTVFYYHVHFYANQQLFSVVSIAFKSESFLKGAVTQFAGRSDQE